MKVFQFDEISISSDQTAPYIDDDKEDDSSNDKYEQLHLSRYRAVKRLKINNNGMTATIDTMTMLKAISE